MLRFVLVASLLVAQPSHADLAVTGSVSSMDRTPVAQAQLKLMPSLNGFEAGQLLLEGDLEPSPMTQDATDKFGRFELEVPESGLWMIQVHASGFVPMQWLYLPVVERRELASVVLIRAEETRVQVLDKGGHPRGGVWVWAESADSRLWRRQRGWRPIFRAGRTDSQGWVTLPRASGEQLRIQVLEGAAIVASRTSGESVVALQADQPTAFHQVEIHPQAAPDARILVQAGPLAWSAGFLEHGRTLHLTGPVGEAWKVSLVTADGFRQPVEWPAPGVRAPPRIVTPPSTTHFTGRVLDSATRRPIAGSIVWLGAAPGTFVHSDRKGRYRLTAPARDRFWLQAEAVGYRPRATWITPEQAASGQAPSLALIRAVELRGKVLGERDRALPGAQLSAIPRRREATDHASFSLDPADGRTHSGDGGGFRLTGLEPSHEYNLLVSLSGYAAVRLEIAAPPSFGPQPASMKSQPAAELVIRLAPSRSGKGLVIDDDEQPIEGAEVILTAAGERPPSPDSGEERSEHRGVSNQEGRFKIAGLPAEEVNITVFKQGFAPLTIRGVEIPATSGAEGSVDLGTLILAPAMTLRGQVVDTEGEGLPEVPIFVVPPRFKPDATRDPYSELLAQRPPATRSDSDGFFRLEDLAPGDRFHLYAGGIEHRGAWVQHIEVPVSDPLRIVLEPGLGLTGRVMNEAGEPIAGAELQLTWEEKLTGIDAPAFHQGEQFRRSDNEGRFVFAGLEPGTVTLDAWAEGYQAASPQELELPIETSSEASELTIVLERGATLEGEVKTAEGQRLDGVRVMAGSPGTISDAEGRYRLDGISPGEVLVEAYHPHYGRIRETLEVELRTHQLDLIFPDGTEVLGQVVDASGEPIPGVALQLDSGGWRGALVHRARSDAEGRFQIRPVTEGDYQIHAQMPGWVLKEPRSIDVTTDGIDDLQIVLESSAVVRGSVLGLDFDQLARVQVSAGDEQDGTVRGELDYTGSYEIRDLEPGYWVVRATLDGGRRQVRERIEIPAGGAAIHRDLTFEERFSLSGTVLLDGEALSGARISVSGRQLAVQREVSSDFSGDFRIDDLESATYNLGVAHSRELVVYNRDLELNGDRDLVIDLAPARVSGRVFDADDGQPLEGTLLRLVRLSEIGEETNALVTRGDPEGAFDFPRAPPGRYRLSARREGYAEATWPLELTTGEARRDLELELTATPGASLWVRLANGGVPSSVDVLIQDAAGHAVLRQSRPVSAKGQVTLPTIPEGVFRLVLKSSGTAPHHSTLNVPGDPVELVLEPAAWLEVRVPDLAFSDAVATLEIVGPDQQAWVGLDLYGQLADRWRMVGGRTSVDGVPAGLWGLRVTSVDGQVWGGTVTAVPGTRTTVELR